MTLLQYIVYYVYICTQDEEYNTSLMKRRWISTQQPDGDVAPCPAAAAGDEVRRAVGWVGLASSSSIHRRQHRTAQHGGKKELLGLQSEK